MKRYTIILLILALLVPSTTIAQKRKKKVQKTTLKAKVEKKEEKKEEDPRILTMLEATQQIMFIDSMVVSKDNFIKHIPLSPECGKLEQNGALGIYTNQLGDRRFEAMPDAKKVPHIFTRDMMGYSWGEPVRVKGLAADATNFPYVMPDGTTLYFAQEGKASIGGYDLFVTRFDAESGTFLKPENLGMPFSSEANDYLYAIDEQHQLGYFVTDRRQPKGKVCIYVFVPNETRHTYVSENYSEEKLRSLASINRIADTWDKNGRRQQALNRLLLARREMKTPDANAGTVDEPQSELDSKRHQAEVLSKALQLARNNYAQSTDSQRQKLSEEILNSERELEQLLLNIRQMEKEERNKQYLQENNKNIERN